MVSRPLLWLGFVACLAALACNALSTSPALSATPQPSLPAPSATPTAAATPTYGPPPTPVPLPEGYPRIARRPAPASWPRGRLSAPPVYDPANTDSWQVDLRAGDASGVDLRDTLDELLQANFDTTTRWPAEERMPAGFDPEEILDLGMNPGLVLGALHAQGIAGRNVGIAIIDQTLLVEHEEYSDRLQIY